MDPFELALERPLPGGLASLLVGQAALLLLEPGRVVALEGDAAAAVEFEYPTRHVVEEIAVMGDGDDRALIVLEEPLEPGDRFGVQMVGGLVKQKQLGAAQQQSA